VQSLLEETPIESIIEETRIDNISANIEYRAAILEYVQALPSASSPNDFEKSRLMRICREMSNGNPEMLLNELSLYLLLIFPLKACKMRVAKVGKHVTTTKKQARRAEYARTQDLWRKNRSKCLRIILDNVEEVLFPSREEMISFWKTVMTSSVKTSPGSDVRRAVLDELWVPITPIEIKKALPANTTSAGSDGLFARFIKKVPTEILCRIFNIIMWCGRHPQHLLEEVTTLIPKSQKQEHLPNFDLLQYILY